jgi:hypothetical protein
VDTATRGRRKKRGNAGEPGTFRPSLPRDTGDVMRVYAIAARVVCVRPEGLEEVGGKLEALAARLVPPESRAAEECARLWALFARVAQVPKETLREEAGKAFCRDLDALGQRLDLPPLADWKDLPTFIDEPGAEELEPAPLSQEPVTLVAVRERARSVAERQPQAAFPAPEAAKLLNSLSNSERRALLEQLVGTGLLGRSDVNLLIRFLVKGEDVGATDTMLIEVLERLGRWLAQ